ncbi:MAG: hypothetical protein PHD55_04810 [Methanoregula sp.]|nr:hypothetical protein [Methanoregula sp.]
MTNTLYPGKANSPQTELSAPYTIGDTTLHVTDNSVLPAAPNTVALYASPSDDTAVTFLYTGKGTGTLTGLALLEGTDKDWDAGTFAARTFTNYDWQAVIDAFSERPVIVMGRATNVEDGVPVSYAPGSLPKQVRIQPVASGADTYMTFMQFVSLESFDESSFIVNIKTNTGSSGNPMTIDWMAFL